MPDDSPAELAVKYLAEKLAEHECHECAAHNDHAVHDEPDWKFIGQEMQKIIATGVRSRFS